ncbi:alkaline shock response membrane anchor protein AmaP [Paenibacillus pasadenensis]|uniref:alkaline shock response membrane anchor protein AmaP n=1 Tax=Paenibacillus TaxID=44249 RepID=UPI000490677F|nr:MULTISPECIES: alkaline shock response membrane anchor protein AmaP [Paenibacillus]QGG56014.1 alkaline shock response membrane anchor protein AmaP [Paenibacillus sp. B01]
MSRIVDRLLLFLYSLAAGIIAIIVIIASAGGIHREDASAFLAEWYDSGSAVHLAMLIGAVLLLLLSLRMFYVAVRVKGAASSSIDQRNDFGDIRISMDTVESLVLKAAGRQRGVKDLKTRITTAEAGLDIAVRAVVDGETSIPQLTEEIQRAVKDHVEEITGIPVAAVSVFVANVISSPSFKSRVE